jgi:hypothetical protein
MRALSKVLFSAFAATALMSLAVGVVSARRFDLSSQRFLAIWTLLRIEDEGVETVACPLTIEGSFHSRTLSKVSGQLVGYVTRAFVRGERAACTNTGTATLLQETLPWHIRYDRFIGPLPNVSGIKLQIVGWAFRYQSEILGFACLGTTTADNPALVTAERAIISERIVKLTPDPSVNIPLSANCALFFARFRGEAEAFVLNSLSTKIVVRLVQ